MASHKTITAIGENADVIIKITVKSTSALTKKEHNELLETAASDAMLLTQSLPYIHVPLSKIRISK